MFPTFSSRSIAGFGRCHIAPYSVHRGLFAWITSRLFAYKCGVLFSTILYRPPPRLGPLELCYSFGSHAFPGQSSVLTIGILSVLDVGIFRATPLGASWPSCCACGSIVVERTEEMAGFIERRILLGVFSYILLQIPVGSHVSVQALAGIRRWRARA